MANAQWSVDQWVSNKVDSLCGEIFVNRFWLPWATTYWWQVSLREANDEFWTRQDKSFYLSYLVIMIFANSCQVKYVVVKTLSMLWIFYRPQCSCDKVMFSQVFVTLFTGGGWQTPPGRHLPKQTSPLSMMATVADGTYPTGMHSCYNILFLIIMKGQRAKSF